MKDISKLLEKKAYWSFLAGCDALGLLRYVQAANPAWTDETWEQLTNFMMSLPVKSGYRFAVVAGPPIVQIDPSPAVQTVNERFRARNAKKAARQQRWRLRKMLPQRAVIQ